MGFEIITVRRQEALDPEFIDYVISCMPDTKIKPDIDLKVITQTVIQFTTQDDHVLLAAKDGLKVVGGFFGSISQFPFTTKRVAGNYYARVRNEYRKQGVGLLLIKAFEKWAKENDCCMVSLGVHDISILDSEGSCESFKKMGYKDYSRDFYKEI